MQLPRAGCGQRRPAAETGGGARRRLAAGGGVGGCAAARQRGGAVLMARSRPRTGHPARGGRPHLGLAVKGGGRGIGGWPLLRSTSPISCLTLRPEGEELGCG